MIIRPGPAAAVIAALLGAPSPLEAQLAPAAPAAEALAPAPALTPTRLPPPSRATAVVFDPVYEFVLAARPAAPPAVDATAAYVPLATGEIVAVDLLHGGVRWRTEMATALAPIAGDGVVIVAGADELLALEATDGRIRWRVPVPEGIASPPLLDTGWVLIGTRQGRVLALHADDGRTLWAAEVGAPVTVRPFAAASGAYVSVSDGRVVSLNITDGTVRWERRVGESPGDLLVLEDRLFVGARDQYWYFYALQTGTGKVAWRQRTGGSPMGAADVDISHVYHVAMDHILYAFARGGGSRRWHQLLTFRPSSGPLVLGGIVAVAGVSAEVYGYLAETGEPVGDARLAADLAGPPVSVPGLLPQAWRPLVLITREGTLRLLQQRVEPAPLPLPYPIGEEIPLTALDLPE